MASEPPRAWSCSTAALSSRCARNCRRSSIETVTGSPSRGGRTLSTSSTTRPLRSLITLRASRRAGKARVRGELDALLAVVLDAGETHHVRHHFACRVVAAEFALLEDSRDSQRHHFRRLLGRNLALEVDELAILSGNLLADLRGGHAEHLRERAEPGVCRLRRGRRAWSRWTPPAWRSRAACRCGPSRPRAMREGRSRGHSAPRPWPGGSRSASPAGRTRGRRGPRSPPTMSTSTKRERQPSSLSRSCGVRFSNFIAALRPACGCRA